MAPHLLLLAVQDLVREVRALGRVEGLAQQVLLQPRVLAVRLVFQIDLRGPEDGVSVSATQGLAVPYNWGLLRDASPGDACVASPLLS